MPFFSVIMPAYNAGKYILEGLDSVLAQTFSDYEVVVVDDGSEDQTGCLVEEWGGRHPIVSLRLLRQENRGIGAARNAGIRNAAGEFVAFLDADDSWLSHKLECIARHLDQDQEVDLVCHDEWLVREKGVAGQFRYGPYASYRDLLFKHNCVSTSATVVRREKLLEVKGFSEDLRFNSVEDYDLWLRLAKAGCRFAYVHETLGRYRVHESGVSQNIAMHCEHTLNLLAAHFHDLPDQRWRSRFLMRRRRADTFRSAGRSLMRRGECGEAAGYLGRAFREDPLCWKTWALGVLNLVRIGI